MALEHAWVIKCSMLNAQRSIVVVAAEFEGLVLACLLRGVRERGTPGSRRDRATAALCRTCACHESSAARHVAGGEHSLAMERSLDASLDGAFVSGREVFAVRDVAPSASASALLFPVVRLLDVPAPDGALLAFANSVWRAVISASALRSASLVLGFEGGSREPGQSR